MKGLAQTAKNTKKAPEKKGADTDMKVVNLMGEEAIEAGADKIGPAVQRAQNPAIALGQLVGQMALQIGAETMDTLELDPGVFLKEGGFMDNTIDYAINKFGLQAGIKEPAFVSAVEMLKSAHQNGNKQQQGGNAPQAQPRGYSLADNYAAGNPAL